MSPRQSLKARGTVVDDLKTKPPPVVMVLSAAVDPGTIIKLFAVHQPMPAWYLGLPN